jgi:hypothetical protein
MTRRGQRRFWMGVRRKGVMMNRWGSERFTYGAECFVRICLHAEETRLYLLVTEQWGVELDAHSVIIRAHQPCL